MPEQIYMIHDSTTNLISYKDDLMDLHERFLEFTDASGEELPYAEFAEDVVRTATMQKMLKVSISIAGRDQLSVIKDDYRDAQQRVKDLQSHIFKLTISILSDSATAVDDVESIVRESGYYAKKFYEFASGPGVDAISQEVREKLLDLKHKASLNTVDIRLKGADKLTEAQKLKLKKDHDDLIDEMDKEDQVESERRANGAK